jgi:plasmid stabilization system protein ParE
MTFELRLSREAEQDLEQIYLYLFELSPEGADRLFLALMSAMTEIRDAPRRWAYFRLTGPPRRARLVSLGHRRIWIVYRVREEARALDILRIWDGRQNPAGL